MLCWFLDKSKSFPPVISYSTWPVNDYVIMIMSWTTFWSSLCDRLIACLCCRSMWMWNQGVFTFILSLLKRTTRHWRITKKQLSVYTTLLYITVTRQISINLVTSRIMFWSCLYFINKSMKYRGNKHNVFCIVELKMTFALLSSVVFKPDIMCMLQVKFMKSLLGGTGLPNMIWQV